MREFVLVGVLLASFLRAHTSDQFNQCNPHKLVELGRRNGDQFYVFALIQDCQLIFARADQLNQLAYLPDVRSQLTYCLPHLVQLHWRTLKLNGNIGIQLLFKRHNNQICTLAVEFPRPNALVGEAVFRRDFSYSLLNSLSYAVCSYMPNANFSMEPELSFMDSTYSDVIYFIDPKSAGSFWTIRQFKFDPNGYLKALETFVVKNFAEETGFMNRQAGEHLISLDAQRKALYSVHKRDKDVSTTCAHELLFKLARIHRQRPLRGDAEGRNYRVNSLGADENVTIISEAQRINLNGFRSRAYISDRHANYSAECVLELPYIAKFGIVSERSLKQMNAKRLPTFDAATRDRTTHKHHSWSRTTKPKPSSSRTTTARPPPTTSWTTSPPPMDDRFEEERPLFTEAEMGNEISDSPPEVPTAAPESPDEQPTDETEQQEVEAEEATEATPSDEEEAQESTNEQLQDEETGANFGCCPRSASFGLIFALFACLLSFI
ncbi:hypothetical protein M3Y99_01397100 [Aphelenchoides fujianensis]|nr:hypothetical protein M3Y99_01397100 [Aphelenchoides fujianensis]